MISGILRKTVLVVLFILLYSGMYPAESSWDEKYSDELIVYDLIETTVVLHRDWTYDYKYRAVKKILKPEALDENVGEIKFDYNKDYESVKSVGAFVVNPDGKKFKYSKKQDFAFNDDSGVYSGDRSIVLTMANVTAGSAIEMEISKICRPRMAGTYYDELHFSVKVPTRVLRRQLSVPRGMKINFQNLNTAIAPIKEEKGDTTVFTWETTNNNKVRDEEFLPPVDEYLALVIVSTVQTWSNISVWYADLFEKNSAASDGIKKQTAKLTKGVETEKEKIQKIIDYIWENFRYVSLNMDSRGYEPLPAAEVFKNKFGDCKGQSLLLQVMLREAGINSYPCLFVSYDVFNASDKLPSPLYFNHVILYMKLDGKPYFLDILQKGYRFGDTPGYLRGAHVFVVNGGSGGFFTEIPPLTAVQNTDRYVWDHRIQDKGDAFVEYRHYYTPDDSVELRKKWKSSSREDWENKMESQNEDASHGGSVFTNYYENIEKDYAPIIKRMTYFEPAAFIRSGKYLVLDNNMALYENLFTDKERENPIAFSDDYVRMREFIYRLPEKSVIVSVPKNLKVKSAFCEYSINYTVVNKKTIKVVGKIRFFKSRWPVGKYDEIKQFFNDAINRSNERIIIKRI